MNSSSADDRAWEKEQVPKVTTRGVGVAFAVYGAWLMFLAALAAQRWFGTLQ